MSIQPPGKPIWNELATRAAANLAGRLLFALLRSAWEEIVKHL